MLEEELSLSRWRGAFLLVSVLCLGGGTGAYFLFRSEGPKNEQGAQKPKHTQPQDTNPNPIEFPKPNPGPQPGPNPGPGPIFFPPAPGPIPVALDPNNPAHMDKVIVILNGVPQDR